MLPELRCQLLCRETRELVVAVLEWIVPRLILGFGFLRGFRSLILVLLALQGAVFAAPRVQPVPVPQEMRADDFTVTVNGQPVDVAHVAASYDFVNFDITGPVDVAITAAEAGFWDRGVDIQPWRLGMRPTREGQTIRFRLEGPAKLSISRPRRFSESCPACCFFLRARRLSRRRPARAALLSAGRLSPEPESEERRDVLSGAGCVFSSAA